MDLNLLEQIRNDISCFVDLGKELVIDASGATWIQNRKDMNIRFTRGDYYPNIIYLGRQYSYKDFFASEYMADLKSLAESMLIIIPNEETTFIESGARLKKINTNQDGKITELLNEIVSTDLPFNKTKLIFIRGEAGLGKTSALRFISRLSARSYLGGRGGNLFFYIDAQAKSLSRLDDVVAAIIQDLQGRFHYRALAILTRLGLLIPIIDGFDELIGLGGYGEAFDSLTRFISRLNASGTVIASARSTFYEYSDIRNKVTRYENIGDIDYELDEVELLHWSDDNITEYIEKKLTKSHQDAVVFHSAIVKAIAETEKELLNIPFFLSTIIEIVIEKEIDLEKDQRLITQIIDYFIEREARKVLNKNGQMLLSKEGHYAFLTQIAEEMWWSESTEIDAETIKLAAEIFAEAYIQQKEERTSFIEKSPTYAFWRNSPDDKRKYSFSHEYYFSFFTAKFAYNHLIEGHDTNQILNRAAIGDTISQEVGFQCSMDGKSDEVIKILSSRSSPFISSEENYENAGNICASIVSILDKIDSLEFKNMIFSKKTFARKKFINSAFSNIKFNNCDFSDAVFDNVSTSSVVFNKPRVTTGGTDFGGIRLSLSKDLIGCIVLTQTGMKELYNPSDIAEICEKINIVTDYPVAEKKVPSDIRKYELVHKFLKIANRYYYISDDDLMKCGITNNTDWISVQSTFLKTNLLQFIHIDRKGHKSIVRKLKYTPEIIMRNEMKSDINEIQEFWKEIYN